MLKRNFAIALAVAMVMAALYGCSSGVSDSTHNDVKDQLTAAQEEARKYKMMLAALDADGDGVADEAARLQGLLDALDMDGDGVADEAARLQGLLDALDADGDGVADSTAALDMDGDGVADEAARLQGLLDALDMDGDGVADEAARLQGLLDALDMDGDGVADEAARLQGILDGLDADGDGVADEAARLHVLLYGEGGTADNPTADSAQGRLNALQQADDDAKAAAESMMAMRLMPHLITAATGTVPTVEVSYDGGATAEADDYGDATSAGSRDGYAGLELVKDNATSTDTVVVFTNVGPDGPKSLLADEGVTDTATFFSLVDDPDGTGDLTDADADEQFAMHATNVGFPSAPQNGSTADRLGSLVTAPGTTDDRMEFSGSWRGVPGVFVCALCTADQGLSVSATLNSDGEEVVTVDFESRVWVFQPTDSKATVDVPDEDYLQFGFWKSFLKADGADPSADFVTFFGANQPVAPIAATLEGEAEFVGVAAGKYVLKEGTSLSPVFRPGVFTAKATLTADFGSDTDQGTISGEITNFMEDGQTMAGGWKVEFESVATNTDGTFASATTADTNNDGKATIHGVDSESSQWNGSFYNGGDAVAGQFRASFADDAANLAGAFGATVVEDE